MTLIFKKIFKCFFGKKYSESYLKKQYFYFLRIIKVDRLSILNDLSTLELFISDLVRSKKIKNQLLLKLYIVQLILIFLFFLNIELGIITIILFSIFFIITSIIFLYSTYLIKTNLVLETIKSWNAIFIQSFNNHFFIQPFIKDAGHIQLKSEDFYAKLWLREMSSSLNLKWEEISFNYVENKNGIPLIKIELGDSKNEAKHPGIFNLTDINNPQKENQINNMIKSFAYSNPILFISEQYDIPQIKNNIKVLNKYFNNLFGKKENNAIVFDDSLMAIKSRIIINDNSDSELEVTKDSLKFYNKIITNYLS